MSLVSTYVCAGMISLVALFFVLAFRPVYKRRIAEQTATAVNTILDDSIIPEDSEISKTEVKSLGGYTHPGTDSPTITKDVESA